NIVYDVTDIRNIRLFVHGQRGGDADNDDVTGPKPRHIRRCREFSGGDDPCQVVIRNVANVVQSLIGLRDANRAAIETENLELSLGFFDREWKTDIADSNDSDECIVREDEVTETIRWGKLDGFRQKLHSVRRFP